MGYIKTFELYTSTYRSVVIAENNSTNFYTEFDVNDFPEIISFSNPFEVEYKRSKLIPGGNMISLRYDLISDQPEKDNPYKGDIPEMVTIDISITYSNETMKSYVTINGGNRTWKSFSYESGIIEDIESTDVELSNKTFKDIKNILNKYSN